MINNGETAISVKTLDARTDFYRSDSPKTVLSRIKGMVNDVAKFKEGKGTYPNGIKFVLNEDIVKERQLHLYLPSGRVVEGQQAQLSIASDYAQSRGVKMIVRYVH